MRAAQGRARSLARRDRRPGRVDGGRSEGRATSWRAKLASSTPQRRPYGPVDTPPDVTALLVQYVERFNRRDWDGLRELVTVDTRVRVADRFSGRLSDSPYFGRYRNLAMDWRMRLAEVDGEPMIVSEYAQDGVWAARGMIRLTVRDGRVAEIADYQYCPWVLASANEVDVQ